LILRPHFPAATVFSRPALLVTAWIVFTVIGVPARADAGEILEQRGSYREGTYANDVKAEINAPTDSVYLLLTDYDGYTALNPGITESTVLNVTGETTTVRFSYRACILIFCRTMKYTMDFSGYRGGPVTGTILPAVSDFSYGFVRWTLRPHGDRSQVHVTSEFRPKFWVPPLIGPYLVKRKLLEEVTTTIRGLEKLSRQRGNAG